MAEMPTTTSPEMAPATPSVVVKKYANRRLYNTETSSYITLDNLAEMIRAGRDFAVYDAKSGDDITRGVLTQIIVEEESKGSAMLPTNFLRQLIGLYGGNLQGVVPNYLEQAMATFSRQQQHMRQALQQTFGSFMPPGVDEISRTNIAMMERAMTMFNPFHRNGEPRPHGAPGAENAAEPGQHELEALRHEVESLRAQLAIAQAEASVQHSLGPVQEIGAPEGGVPEIKVPELGVPEIVAPEPDAGQQPAEPMRAAPAKFSRKGPKGPAKG